MYNARKVPESGRDLKRVKREFFTQAVVERHEHGNDFQCYSGNEVLIAYTKHEGFRGPDSLESDDVFGTAVVVGARKEPTQVLAKGLVN